jgi:uncharacterized protein
VIGEDEGLPPYTYVPGGPWPHPTCSPGGHSAGRARPTPGPIVGGDWKGSGAYRRGVGLFNAGYYWEAHEEWEGLWHAHGRRGPVADVLKALIKLAAAGVKVREGQPGGVRTHASRAAGLLESVRRQGEVRLLGLELGPLAEIARGLAEDPPRDPGPRDRPVGRVFAFRIEPD